MKVYSAKTLEDALEIASKDMNIAADEIVYEIVSEKKGFFGKSKSVQISVFDMYDVVTYIEDYLRKLIGTIGLDVKIKSKLDDDIVSVEINCPENNSVLIGHQGNTLEAITTLVRQSASQHFKKHVIVRLDVSGYKQKRYRHLEHLAKVWGRNVIKTKEDLLLDPLPPDERRIVHQTLSTFHSIETKSVGEGKYKRLNIIYIGRKKQLTEEVEEEIEVTETEE